MHSAGVVGLVSRTAATAGSSGGASLAGCFSAAGFGGFGGVGFGSWAKAGTANKSARIAGKRQLRFGIGTHGYCFPWSSFIGIAGG